MSTPSESTTPTGPVNCKLGQESSHRIAGSPNDFGGFPSNPRLSKYITLQGLVEGALGHRTVNAANREEGTNCAGRHIMDAGTELQNVMYFGDVFM